MDIRIDTENKKIKRGDPAGKAWNNSAEKYDRSAAQELSFSGLDTPKKKKKAQEPQKLMETPIRKEPVRKPADDKAVPQEKKPPVRRASEPKKKPDEPKKRPPREKRPVQPAPPEEKAAPVMTEEEAAEFAEMREKRRKLTTRLSVIAAVIFVIGILSFLVYRFVRVEHITVSGNDELTADYIAELSGLTEGEHIFAIDVDALEKNFLRDARVEYLDMVYTFPNRIELQIKECMPVAKFALSDGGYLQIDSSGKALGKKQELRENILIEGADLTEYSIGYPIRTADTFKQSVLCELLTALKEADYDDQIERLDINVITNIKLYNRSGMEIRFGDSENLELKIKWTEAVIENLSGRAITEGVVDVYSKDKAIYSRPETESVGGDVELNYIDIHYDDLEVEDLPEDIAESEETE